MPREPARQIIGRRQVRHDALLKSRACAVCVHQLPLPLRQRSTEDAASTTHLAPCQDASSVHCPLPQRLWHTHFYSRHIFSCPSGNFHLAYLVVFGRNNPSPYTV